MSDSNENILSASSSTETKASLLPNHALQMLKLGMRYGFEKDTLTVRNINLKIDDSLMPELCKWITKLQNKIKVLDLQGNFLTSVGASLLFKTLRSTDSPLKQVNLSSNRGINDDCIESLGEYLKFNKSITTIKLGATQITDSGIEKLEPYLIGNTTLKLLYLAETFRISEKSTPILVNVVNSSQIYEINITGTYIGNKSPIAVALACNCIKYGSDTINLSTKGIDEDDLVTIYNCMKKYGIEHLKDINLYKNNMTSKTASLLFDTLRECNSVVSRINVSLNKLDDECMHSLGELIQDNEYLEQLAINGNQITDKGIEILSEYLMGNTTLKELGLSYCLGITDTSIPLLIQVIKSTYIQSLHIDFGVISSERQQEARDALLIPIDQRQIPIKSNTKSAAKSFASIKA